MIKLKKSKVRLCLVMSVKRLTRRSSVLGARLRFIVGKSVRHRTGRLTKELARASPVGTRHEMRNSFDDGSFRCSSSGEALRFVLWWGILSLPGVLVSGVQRVWESGKVEFAGGFLPLGHHGRRVVPRFVLEAGCKVKSSRRLLTWKNIIKSRPSSNYAIMKFQANLATALWTARISYFKMSQKVGVKCFRGF